MRRGISRRVLTVVTLVTTALLGCAVLVGMLALGRVRSALVEERARLARALAAETERLLDNELEGLATVAVAADRDPEALSLQLRAAYRDSKAFDTAFVAAISSDLPILIEPSAVPLQRSLVEDAQRLAASGRPGAHVLPGGGAVVALPARGHTEQIIGVVGGVIPSTAPELTKLLAAATPAPNGWIELQDASGAAAVRVGGAPAGREAAAIVVDATVGPLGWRVVVGQPERDALGAIARIQWWMLGAAPLVLAITLFLTWGATKSVVRPLQELTVAAEAIARGDLDCVVPPGGSDEAGRLARAFDEMRRALKLSVRRALLEKTLTAQEDERRRISRELHDETSQTVNALLMKLDAALAANTPVVERREVLQVRDLAVRLLDGVHRLILALRPSLLDDLGLFPAIEWFARDQLAPLGVSVRFEADDPDVRLPRDIELALFRVAQEAITNIARHSHADMALVECAIERDGVVIDIEDDGEGFDMTTVSADPTSLRGLGLAGMRERVALVGGRLSIESSPGSGTHLRIAVPLRKEAMLHV